MSSRTHLAPLLIALVAAAGVFAYAEQARVAPQTVMNVPAAATTTAVQARSAPNTTMVVRPAGSAGAAAAPAAISAVPAAANASLMVGTTTYPVSVTPGETVIDAMRALAAANNTFVFTGREYPGLGFFADSINGKENAGGLDWMLYVNGVSASVGASSAVMKAGDTVEWRYEKSY